MCIQKTRFLDTRSGKFGGKMRAGSRAGPLRRLAARRIEPIDGLEFPNL
jgi:hypothetical protein